MNASAGSLDGSRSRSGDSARRVRIGGVMLRSLRLGEGERLRRGGEGDL